MILYLKLSAIHNWKLGLKEADLSISLFLFKTLFI